jgi:hypothetical protein
VSDRFEQASLDGLDLDEELADLPLRRTPSSRERTPSRTDPDVESGSRSSNARERGSGMVGSGNLDLFDDPEQPVPGAREPIPRAREEGDQIATEERAERGEIDASSPGSRPSPAERLLGGLADLTVHLGVLAASLLAMSSLSLLPAPDQWPGFLVFLLCFSFLYHVVPLAFWGQTPGMAWRGLRARDAGGEPLSFGQSGLRWLGALVTVGLLGLPLLLALHGGGSLSDRASRSRTLRRH